MNEADAFAFIQRTAMSERTKMRDVAERILDGSLRPDSPGRRRTGTDHGVPTSSSTATR